MELKAKDIYKVQGTDFISMNTLTSLTSLYQPLISPAGVDLYLTLISEGSFQRTQETHARLGLLLNMSMDDLERARVKLEEFLLLSTYVLSDDSKNTYLYVLHAPLSINSFLGNRVFMNQYAAVLGRKQTEQTLSKFSTPTAAGQGYKDITRPVVHVDSNSTYDMNIEYHDLKPKYDFSDDDVAINFDYDHFIATTSTLVFPAELRTQQNLKLIGKLATVYGLTADHMRLLVSRCVSLSLMKFDADKLKLMSARSKADILQAKDPYSLPPVSFLQAKQHGAEVSLSDKKILENLSLNKHFSNEVINVLIEYILVVSDNRLIPAFVDSVAGEWARDNIKTKEQALEKAKNRTRTVSRHKDVMPAYVKNMNQGSKEERSATEEEKQEVLELLKQMEGAHAKD